MYTNNQEFESIRLGETLSFLEDGKVGICYAEKEHGLHFIGIRQPLSCTDPERFARGGPTLRGKRIQIALKAVNHQLTSETPNGVSLAGR